MIYLLLIIPLLANIWVHWVFSPIRIWLIKNFKDAPARYKPIDCEACLSFWIFVLIYLRCDYIWQGVLISGAGYFIANLYSRVFVLYLNKIYVRFRDNRKVKK